MRVLMVCPELPSPGSPGSMAPAARQFESLRELGVETHVVDMRGIPKLKYFQAVPHIMRLARRCDLVHGHFGYCGWLARVARFRPMVMSFMGDDLLGTPTDDGSLEWFSRVMVRANIRLARRADAVIVKSEQMARVIAPVESTVIPNGVDLDVFCPMQRQECRRQLGIDDGLKVLFPGNPDNPRKGWTLAVDSVERASELIGRPVELVPLWGVLPDQVPVYMNACDAMLMTSLIEGSPNVVKEAMACDLPVVGVPVGDVEQMLGGVEGCAFCQRDPELVSGELARVILSGRCQGRKAIVDRGLDLQSVARRVLAVYDRVLQPRPTRRVVGYDESMRRVNSPSIGSEAR